MKGRRPCPENVRVCSELSVHINQVTQSQSSLSASKLSEILRYFVGFFSIPSQMPEYDCDKPHTYLFQIIPRPVYVPPPRKSSILVGFRILSERGAVCLLLTGDFKPYPVETGVYETHNMKLRGHAPFSGFLQGK